jgi:hypothetical protein
MEQKFTLDNILKSEPFILADSSIQCSPDGIEWYRQGVYPAKEFSQLNICFLHETMQGLDEMYNFLSKDTVHTVPRVVSELEKASEIVHAKLEKMIIYDKCSRSFKRHNGDKLRQRYRFTDECADDNRRLFSEVCWRFREIAHKAAKSAYIPQDESVFALLFEMAVGVAALTGSKIDSGPKYGVPAKTDDSHADEELVAAALYKSMVEKEPCTIVTADADIYRITNWIHRYVGVIEPKIRVYCLSHNCKTYNLRSDTSFVPMDFNSLGTHDSIVDTIQETMHKMPLETVETLL